VHGGRVVDANNNFIVYEDGHMVAESGSFKGHIEATSGKIGNMTIGEVENTVSVSKQLEIESPKGYSFKVNNFGGSPTSLILTAKP